MAAARTPTECDFYSLDLAAAEGLSLGAPVYAAAPGAVLAWVPASGTLILDHGDDLYTMYTHMGSTPYTQPLVRRYCAVHRVGNVGDRGAPGNTHLHFTAFTGNGPGGRSERQSVPLRFAEGYTAYPTSAAATSTAGHCSSAESRRWAGCPAAPTYRRSRRSGLALASRLLRPAAPPAPPIEEVRVPQRWP